MRLADFILSNLEAILAEWEVFARSISPGAKMSRLELRDHAEDILRATARDMVSKQTELQQADKSKGEGEGGSGSAGLDTASEVHAVGRVDSGFQLLEVTAEYRALRASVLRLWRASEPRPETRDIDDITRFNESIDQSLTEALSSYTKRVEKSRKLFLAMLGHDLRNPLSSVVMASHLLSQTLKLDAQAAQLMSVVERSAQTMEVMINDLLDFTTTQLGAAIPLEVSTFDLTKLCQEVIDEAKVSFPDRKVDLEGSESIVGKWDEARLRQVISNLLGNAIQHGTADKPVTISLKLDGTEVALDVSNHGPCISQDVIGTIFDPLVRGISANQSGHKRAGSIGLGLYIARQVVNAHRGTIQVTSANDKTVFSVRLPMKSEAVD